MHNKNLLAYILNILAMLFWGMSFVWIKIVYEYYHPFTVLVFRLSIAAALLFLISYKFRGGREKISKKDIPFIMLLAFCEPFMYFVGESFGLLYVSSTVASLMVATIPVFMVVASHFFLDEKINIFSITGLVFSVLGIFLLVFGDGFAFRYSPRGILLMFLAIISAIGFNVIGARLLKKYRPITLIKYQNFLGAIYFLPLFLIFGDISAVITIPPKDILIPLINLSVFSSTCTYLFYMIAVDRLGMNRANIFTYLIPVFTAIFSFFLLGERFSTEKLFAMSFIIIGIIISQSGRNLVRRFLFRRGS